MELNRRRGSGSLKGMLLAIFFVFPLLPLIFWSLSAGWRWPELLPTQLSLRAWAYVLSPSSGTWEAVGNSLTIAFGVTAINLALSLPAADALARMDFRGKKAIEAVLYAPLVVPPFAAMMGIHFTFVKMGLTESLPGVILSHLPATFPYVLRALTTSYQTLGLEWEEQASMLGAGPMQRLRHVVLPHLVPGMAVGSSLSILISLSQYVITLLVGGGQVMTIPLLLFPFLSGGDQAIGAAYTMAFVGLALFSLMMMDKALKQYYQKRLDDDREEV